MLRSFDGREFDPEIGLITDLRDREPKRPLSKVRPDR